jgi:hypothetical protein
MPKWMSHFFLAYVRGRRLRDMSGTDFCHRLGQRWLMKLCSACRSLNSFHPSSQPRALNSGGARGEC